MVNSQLDRKPELLKQFSTSGLQATEFARLKGINCSTFSGWLRDSEYHQSVESRVAAKIPEVLRLHESGMSIEKISPAVKMARKTVKKILITAGRMEATKGISSISTPKNKEFVLRQMCREKLTIRSGADKFGIDEKTLKRWVNEARKLFIPIAIRVVNVVTKSDMIDDQTPWYERRSKGLTRLVDQYIGEIGKHRDGLYGGERFLAEAIGKNLTSGVM